MLFRKYLFLIGEVSCAAMRLLSSQMCGRIEFNRMTAINENGYCILTEQPGLNCPCFISTSVLSHGKVKPRLGDRDVQFKGWLQWSIGDKWLPSRTKRFRLAKFMQGPQTRWKVLPHPATTHFLKLDIMKLSNSISDALTPPSLENCSKCWDSQIRVIYRDILYFVTSQIRLCNFFSSVFFWLSLI